MSGIEYYYAGKMLLVRCETLSCFIEEDTSISATLFVGDIRRGLLVNTENGYVRAVHYTHKGMLEKGYVFGSTGDLADSKLLEMIHGSDLPVEACEASSLD